MKRSWLVVLCIVTGCTAEPVPGPDKQFGGGLHGALTGAGAGAVTGFQLGVGSGPGALVGAGLGAVAGGVQGALQDRREDRRAELTRHTSAERNRAVVHEIMQDHFVRRIELHPSRDLYPADLFFNGDDTHLCSVGRPLVAELARQLKHRMPWSRIAVTAYVRSKSSDDGYARRLAELRAREISDYIVRSGVQPRRVEARGVVMNAPLLIDPLDHPDRYSQAIEFIPVDR